jgi:hypothetical protein
MGGREVRPKSPFAADAAEGIAHFGATLKIAAMSC